MLEVLKVVAGNPSFRRFLVFLLTAAATLLHRKFGLDIEASTIEWLVGLAIAYITGGNLKDALVSHAKAKAQALPSPSVQEAAAELSKSGVPG